MTKFYTNGTLDDVTGTGVTLVAVPEVQGVVFESVSPTGANGYLAEEISQEEYETWKARIAAPDMVKYFPGIFPGVGVVNKKVYTALQKARQKDLDTAEEEKLKTLAPGYKMAAAIAKLTGESAVDVLKAFRPDLPEATITALEKKAKLQ
jgi:hypothetical protein